MDLVDIEKDVVLENPYREQEDVTVVEPSVESIIEPSTELIEGTVVDNDIVVEVGVGAESMVTYASAVADIVSVEDTMAVVSDSSNVAEDMSVSLESDEVKEPGEIMKLPHNKADYTRMSVAEKVRCYPFDDKGTDVAFETEQQRRYEVFDRIYEEGMREKKVERKRNIR